MRATLIALHGYTMNGARLRDSGEQLFRVLEQHVNLVFPDAPHVCPPEVAAAAFKAWGMAAPEPPHLRWWRASNDGLVYEGWEAACASVRALISEDSPVGVLGFSQGAMLAGLLSALSARGRFPALHCAVLIAGGVPRAQDLAPLFAEPIALPSLHVWGERDTMANSSAPRLAQCFEEQQRATVCWPGSHAIPQDGAVASSIVRFVQERLGAF